MMEWMDKICPIQPTYSGEEHARANIVRIALLIIPLPTVVLFILNMFMANYAIASWEISIGVLSLFCLWLLRKGWLNISVLLLMIGLSLIATMICTVGNGIHDMAITVYPLVILFSALIQRTTYVVGMTAFVIACVAWVVFGESLGYFTPSDYGNGLYIDVVIMAIILGSGSVLTLSLSSYIYNAVENMRKEMEMRTSMQEDIKNYLKEKSILLREVHHRIKNNLSFLNSLIDIESYDREEDRARLQQVQKRIYSLSRVHDRLFKTENYNQVETVEFVEDIKESFIEAGKFKDANLTTEICELTLDLYRAIPLGICIHEIMTYTSTRSMDAKLHVELQCDDKNIELTFTGEHGVFDDLVGSRSLEARFVEQMIRRISGNRFLNDYEMRIKFPRMESTPNTSTQSQSVLEAN